MIDLMTQRTAAPLPRTPPEGGRPPLLALLAALVLGAGMLIVAHGCHGPNEDHELFMRQGAASTER